MRRAMPNLCSTRSGTIWLLRKIAHLRVGQRRSVLLPKLPILVPAQSRRGTKGCQAVRSEAGSWFSHGHKNRHIGILASWRRPKPN